MPDLNLDVLAELERNATEGRWQRWLDLDGTADMNGYVMVGDERGVVTDEQPEVEECNPVARFYIDADADLIVALRNALPDLIAAARERDRLRALLAEVRLIAGPEDKTGRALLHILDGA